MKFEYKIYTKPWNASTEMMLVDLNKLGQQGWEVVSWDGVWHYLLKRCYS